ncbi:MAG: SDR family oxidoreductase [Actinomycetales bacterium]|nr:SDR family oxidoreductase [Actinomycetales bacterium]
MTPTAPPTAPSAAAPAALVDPRTRYRMDPVPDEQDQPGTTGQTLPHPDHGEESYRGSGRLEGMRALITGGDSGIGRAVAIAFAREGADVAISFLPEEEADARKVGDLVEAAGRRVLLLPGDIRDATECDQLVRDVVDGLGALDILVLNAGYQKQREGLENTPIDEIRRVIETNELAPLWIARAAIPHLRPGASIITTTSIQAFDPSPALLDYAMTKASHVAFTKALAQELGPKGVRVNAVAPGPIWTPLIPATSEEFPEGFGENTPLGRPGQPAEVAPAYVFLASPEASYVSGAIVPVTGGKGL